MRINRRSVQAMARVSAEAKSQTGWTAAIIAAVLILAFQLVMFAGSIKAFAWDFHMFYAAGAVGEEQLYDLEAQRAVEEEVWREERSFTDFSFSPFFRPAYYRLVLVPLAELEFWTAFKVWSGFQALCFIGAFWLLGRSFHFSPAHLIVLALCRNVLLVLVWGQDTAFVLLCLAATLVLGRKGHDAWAGVFLALALVKWNVIVLIPVTLLLIGRWRLFGWFAAAATVEVAISLWIMGLTGLQDLMTALQHPSADYLKLAMPSLRSLLLNLGMPDPLVAALVIAGVGLVLWYARRLPFEQAVSLAAAGGVFLSYHSMGYDVLLLFLPLFVFQMDRFTGWIPLAAVFVLSPFPTTLAGHVGGWIVAAAATFFMAALAETLRRKSLSAEQA